MQPTPDLKAIQRNRHRADVASGDAARPSVDRLKSRALEASVLAGRTVGALPDGMAVLELAAGAANVLRIDLSTSSINEAESPSDWLGFADVAGRLADAAEKIDHLEDFRPGAVEAVVGMARWGVARAAAAA